MDAHVSDRAKRRGQIFAGLRNSRVDRRTRDVVYDVLTDARPVGNQRCRKVLPVQGVCSTCFLLHSTRTKELTTHMVIECPLAEMFIDTVARAVMQVTALDMTQLDRAAALGTDELLQAVRAAVVTGDRELAPILTGRNTGGTAFRIAVHEATRILVETRDRNADVWRRGVRDYSVRSMYTTLRRRFLQVARDARRAAYEREAELNLIYPGWEPSEGKGPVEDWKKDFTQPGYVCEQGGSLVCRLPERVEQIEGSWAASAPDTTRLRLLTHADRPRDRPVKVVIAIAPRSTPKPTTRQLPTTLPATTWVGYTDGSHTPLTPPATPEIAGWAYAIVRGGDGQADEHASVVTEGWGPVATDEDAPYFAGASKLSNNTAELSAIIELLLRIERALDAGEACDRVIVRPDSTYASNIATG